MKTLINRLRRSDTDFKELMHGGAVAFLVKILGAGSAFAMNVVIARELGADQAGLYFLAYTLVIALAAISRLGLDNTLVRFIASHHAAQEWPEIRQVFGLSVRWSLVASVLAAMLLWLWAEVLARDLFGRPEFATVIRLMAPVIPLMALFTLHASALQGIKRILESQSSLSVVLPLTMALLALLIQPADARTAALLLFAASAGVLALSVWWWWRALPRAQLEAVTVDQRAILASCLPLLMVVASNQIVTWSSQIFLGVWADAADVAVFNAAQRTAILISLVLVAVNSIAAPKFAALYRLGQHDALRKTALHATRVMLGLALIPFTLIQIGAEPILSLFGAEFTAGATVLRILALGQLVNVATGSVGFLLSMTGHERLLRNNVLVAAVVALGGGVALIPPFGLIGAAVATAAGMAIQNLLCVWQVRRVLGFNTLAIWQNVSAPRLQQPHAQPAQPEVLSSARPSGQPNLQARQRSTPSYGLPSMSIFFILMMFLSLILSLILALTYWPGSAAYLGGVDPSLYRESILWGLGGVFVASLFAALARVFYDLNRLVEAVVRRQPTDEL